MYNCFSKLLVGDIIILHHDPKRRQVQHVKQSWNDYKESNDVGNFQPVSVPGAKRQKWTKTVRKLCFFEPSTAACSHIYDTRGNKLHFPFTGLIQTLLSTNTSYRLPRVPPLLCEVRQLLPYQVPKIAVLRVYMNCFLRHQKNSFCGQRIQNCSLTKKICNSKGFLPKAQLKFFYNHSTKRLFSKSYFVIDRQNTRTSFSVFSLAHTANNLSSSGVALNLPVSEADGDVHERNCAHKELCFLFKLEFTLS